MNNLKPYYSFINLLLRKEPTKFGIKLGVVAGTAYYIAEQGVWKDSNTTRQVYDRIKTASAPYTKQITQQIPYEFPSLPSSGEISYLANYYWNKGVRNTFAFLINVPSYISEYSKKGVDAILDNSEVKNVISDVKN